MPTTIQSVTSTNIDGDRFDAVLQALENGSASEADLDLMRRALAEPAWRQRYVQLTGLTSLLREQGRAIQTERERLRWRQAARLAVAALLLLSVGLGLGSWSFWPQDEPAASVTQVARPVPSAVIFGPGSLQDLDEGRLQKRRVNGQQQLIGRMDWKKPGVEWLMSTRLAPGLFQARPDQMLELLVKIHKPGTLQLGLQLLVDHERQWFELPVTLAAGVNLVKIPIDRYLPDGARRPITGWRIRYPRHQPVCSEVHRLRLQPVPEQHPGTVQVQLLQAKKNEEGSSKPADGKS